MHRSYWWCALVLVTLFGRVIPQENSQFQIDEQRIALQKEAIARELFWNKIERGSVNVALLTAAAYIGYRAYNSDNTSIIPCKGHGPLPSFGSWQWTKERLSGLRDKSIEHTLAFGLAAGVKEFFSKHLYHPGDIEWFIKTHTSLFVELELMVVYAHALDNPHEFTIAQCEYAIQALTMQIAVMLRQLEQLLGFLHYKKQQSRNGALQQATEQIVTHVMNQAHELGAACEQRINTSAQSTSAVKLEEHVKQFSSEILAVVNRFTSVEHNAALLA